MKKVKLPFLFTVDYHFTARIKNSNEKWNPTICLRFLTIHSLFIPYPLKAGVKNIFVSILVSLSNK